MAKQPRTQMSGKEARYILKQNNVNIAWLSEQLGITPQSMNSRLNSVVFKKAYQMEINSICERRIFDVEMSDVIVEVKGRIPVIDIRISAGFGLALMEGNEQRVSEYVTMEGLNGCVGVYVKLRQLLNDYDERLERIPDPGLYSCEQLRDLLKSMHPHQTGTTFCAVAQMTIDDLRRDGRDTTAKMREQQVKKFITFLGNDILLEMITPRTIADYSRHLTKDGCSIGYHNMQMNMVKTVINHAIREGYVRYDTHPFAYYTEQTPEPREEDIPVSDIRLIRDYKTPYKGERKARDLFMLSYYLGGINLIDLLAYDFRDTDILEYVRTKTRNRKKTNRTVSFSIPPEAIPIISHYMNKKTGRLDFGTSGSYDTFKNIVTRDIKRIAKKSGIKDWQRCCYYTARKSFVQHGFDLGISLEVLEYCIGQSMKSSRPIFNYLKIMRNHADNAIRQIIDNLNEKEPGPHGQDSNV